MLYIYKELPANIQPADIFVNQGIFDLNKSPVEVQQFWKTIELLQPDIYASEGTALTIVTKNEQLSKAIAENW